MPADPTVFEIPICRSSLSAWCEERRIEEERMRREMRELHSNGLWPLPPSASDEAVDAILAAGHRGWHFNETVGWIRIFTSYQKIWGELFFCKQRVTKHLRHKDFEWKGKVFETGSFAADSSADIFSRICRELDRLSCKRWCRGRHIEKSAFLRTGAEMNWRKLTNLE